MSKFFNIGNLEGPWMLIASASCREFSDGRMAPGEESTWAW